MHCNTRDPKDIENGWNTDDCNFVCKMACGKKRQLSLRGYNEQRISSNPNINITKPNTMMIDWYIGKRCNSCCSYCADFIHDNYSVHVSFEKMKIFVDKIVERYGTNIHWSLTGGESTLNPSHKNS